MGVVERPVVRYTSSLGNTVEVDQREVDEMHDVAMAGIVEEESGGGIF